MPHGTAGRLFAFRSREGGVSTDEYAAELFAQGLPASVIDAEEQKRLNAPSIALLQSWLAQGEAPRSPEEIAGTEAEIEDLMRNLNAPRREAGERLHFPDVEAKP